ncbi:hypothetical protein Rin_00020010 [Candidatus Regiella insecticola 5.15]|uniref:Uncharacterized protein n=1 Tax=Candidatus Regiella insecticola 5.15 TaxID=1005043 RepID=G2H1Q7_9ENTR|nr:hypothetical protein [Candidatus Regiella insecticola]EGY28073.1 hypothetical protein Rin_00020010 [Candidatus Regiella insecticola 5.15]
MTAGIMNNRLDSIVECNPQVLKGTIANLGLEDEFPAVSPLSNQSPIQENKASHLERSFELSKQKIKELGDIFTEVDRKPASELTNQYF